MSSRRQRAERQQDHVESSSTLDLSHRFPSPPSRLPPPRDSSSQQVAMPAAPSRPRKSSRREARSTVGAGSSAGYWSDSASTSSGRERSLSASRKSASASLRERARRSHGESLQQLEGRRVASTPSAAGSSSATPNFARELACKKRRTKRGSPSQWERELSIAACESSDGESLYVDAREGLDDSSEDDDGEMGLLDAADLQSIQDFRTSQPRTWRRISVDSMAVATPTRPPSRLSLIPSDSELHPVLFYPKRTTVPGATADFITPLPSTPPPSVLLPAAILSGSTIRTFQRPSSLRSSLPSPNGPVLHDHSTPTSPSRLSWQPKPLLLTPNRISVSPSTAPHHSPGSYGPPSPFSLTGTSPRYGGDRQPIDSTTRSLTPNGFSLPPPRRRSLGYLLASREDSTSGSSGMWDEQTRKMRESPDSSEWEEEEEDEIGREIEGQTWGKRGNGPLEAVGEEGRPAGRFMWDASDEGSEEPRAPRRTTRIEDEESATDDEDDFETSDEQQDDHRTTRQPESGTSTHVRPSPPLQLYSASPLPAAASLQPFHSPSKSISLPTILALVSPSLPPSFPFLTVPTQHKTYVVDQKPHDSEARQERQIYPSNLVGGANAQARRTSTPALEVSRAKALPNLPCASTLRPPFLPSPNPDAVATSSFERLPPPNPAPRRGPLAHSLSTPPKSTASSRSLSNTFSTSSIKALVIAHRSERALDIRSEPWPPGDDGETKVLSAGSSLAPKPASPIRSRSAPAISPSDPSNNLGHPSPGLRWEPRDPRATVDRSGSALRSFLDSSALRPTRRSMVRSLQQRASPSPQSTPSQRTKSTSLSFFFKLKRNSPSLSSTSSQKTLSNTWDMSAHYGAFPVKPVVRQSSPTSTFEENSKAMDEPPSPSARTPPFRLLPRPPRRPMRYADSPPDSPPTHFLRRQSSFDEVVPVPPSPTTMAVASLLFAGPLGPSYPSSFRIATLVPSPAESRRHSNADSFSSITLRDPTPSPRSPRIAGTPPSERPPSVFPTRKKKLAQVGEDGISSRAVPPMSVDTFLLEGRPRSIFPTRKAKKEARVLVRTG